MRSTDWKSALIGPLLDPVTWYGIINAGTQITQWDSGTVGQWDSGTVGQWDSGTVGQWDSGTVGQWDSGTVGQWDSGTVGQWDSGTVGQWGSGTVGQWGSGTVGKQRNSNQSSPTLLCFESPKELFSFQHNLFRTMGPDHSKAYYMSTHNHLLYFGLLCRVNLQNNQQKPTENFARFPNHFPIELCDKETNNKKSFLPLREVLGIQWSYLSKRKEKQLVGVEAKIRQRTVMIILSKPPVVSLI